MYKNKVYRKQTLKKQTFLGKHLHDNKVCCTFASEIRNKCKDETSKRQTALIQNKARGTLNRAQSKRG